MTDPRPATPLPSPLPTPPGFCRARPLSAAVRARTILATCDHARVFLIDHVGGTDPVTGPAPDGAARTPTRAPARTTPRDAARLQDLCAVVDWQGTAHLLAHGAATPPRGRITVVCSAEGLGSLLIEGLCDRARPVAAVPGLTAHLTGSDVPAGPDGSLRATLEAARLTAVPVIPTRVTVVPHAPATRHDGRHLPVPLDLFAAAEPDPWTVHGPALAHHLEHHHQADLRELVLRRTGRAEDVVAVRRLTPEGLDLTCLSARGATEEHLRFDPPLGDPAELGRRLRPGR